MINLEEWNKKNASPPFKKTYLLLHHTSFFFFKFSRSPQPTSREVIKIYSPPLFKDGGGQNYAKAALVKGEGVHACWDEAVETLARQTSQKY